MTEKFKLIIDPGWSGHRCIKNINVRFGEFLSVTTVVKKVYWGDLGGRSALPKPGSS